MRCHATWQSWYQAKPEHYTLSPVTDIGCPRSPSWTGHIINVYNARCHKCSPGGSVRDPRLVTAVTPRTGPTGIHCSTVILISGAVNGKLLTWYCTSVVQVFVVTCWYFLKSVDSDHWCQNAGGNYRPGLYSWNEGGLCLPHHIYIC